MNVLALKDIEKYYGAEQVLNGVTVEIGEGERVGLVGSNGSGKTTLFKIISGEEPFDKGDLMKGKELSIGYLAQIPDYAPHTKVIDIFYMAFAELFQVKNEMANLEQQMGALTGDHLEREIKKYGELQQAFETGGGYEIDADVARICDGLGITPSFQQKDFSVLSGGEKTTVCLGKLLLQKADILLLDEPSNHLDLQSLEWLEGYLKDYKGTVVIISHDRYFLDSVVTKIIELEDGMATSYMGNYSSFVKQKEEQLELQLNAFETQQKKIKSMEQTIKDLKEWGIRADNPKFHKRAASMQKRLDKLERLGKPVMERPKMKLEFGGTGRSGKDVVVVDQVNLAYGAVTVLKKASLLVTYGERVCILGKNGSGKSSLLKLILGFISPQQGALALGANVKVGYLPQEVVFDDPSETVIGCFRKNQVITEGDARKRLAKFLFYGWDVFKKVGDLSGGEKSRLRLCQLMYQDINLLILDEPTNHLDISAIEVFEEALRDFSGTILFVSHDRAFINRVADRVVELSLGKLVSFPGDYDYYRTKKIQLQLAVESKDAPKKGAVKVGKPGRKSPSTAARDLEAKIEELETEISRLNSELERWTSNYEKLHEIHSHKDKVQSELDALLESWVASVE